MSARTFSAARGYSPPLDHLALQVVDDAGTTWLADVGFGRHTEFPLRFDDRADQKDPGGLFRIAENDDAELTILRDGEAEYRVDPKPLRWRTSSRPAGGSARRRSRTSPRSWSAPDSPTKAA